MERKIVKLLNLIRFRIIGTIILSITIAANAIEATAPNVDYRFIIPILVLGCILLLPLFRGRHIIFRIYRRGINKYKSVPIVCLFFLLGFHNKLVGITIEKKNAIGWLFFIISVIGSIIIIVWAYLNNIPLWLFIIIIILSIYRILNSLYS